MEKAPTLCLILKAPRPGFVKTRLAREVGIERATRIYRRLVEIQMDHLPPSWQLEVHYAPGDAEQEMVAWLGERPSYAAQADGDLGVRLIAATQSAFSRGASAVVLLGGDCPGVSAKLLETVREQLRSHDLVIGPAEDGGYYLLAIKTVQPFLFEGIAWSTPHVFTQTMERASRHALRASILEVLTDVDDLNSWGKVRDSLSLGQTFDASLE